MSFFEFLHMLVHAHIYAHNEHNGKHAIICVNKFTKRAKITLLDNEGNLIRVFRNATPNDAGMILREHDTV